GFRVSLSLLGACFTPFSYPTLTGGGVSSRRNGLHAFAEDSLCQNRSCSCAIACDFAGFRCDFLHHLGAHIFERIFQFNLLRDGNTIFRNQRRAKFLARHARIQQRFPGLFKNAIDWLSRPVSDIPEVFGNRPVGVIGASPGSSSPESPASSHPSISSVVSGSAISPLPIVRTFIADGFYHFRVG